MASAKRNLLIEKYWEVCSSILWVVIIELPLILSSRCFGKTTLVLDAIQAHINVLNLLAGCYE